ncbi:MAG: TMEM165/GDT1 family protein [Burkholderiales bacterium]
MEAFIVSAAVVAIGEIGDKTQLLALLLGARFRQPVPIIAGIFCATLLNHLLAGLLGNWIRSAVNPDVLRWGLAASFLAIAAWALKPDTLDEKPREDLGRYGVFAMTLIAFFFAEIGDKTQLATIALAARFHSLAAVVAGTTTGMLIADVPAVLLAEKVSLRIPLKAVRYVAAALFAVMGATLIAGIRIF